MARRKTREVWAAGGAVVRNFASGPRLLLIADPYGKWGLPKGHTEDGETLRETALREVSEETGLSDLELGPELLTIDWTFRAGGTAVHKFATFFLMFSNEGDPVPQRSEGIRDAEWFPLESAHDRISYPNAAAVVRAAQAILDGRPAEPHTEPVQGRVPAPGGEPT